MVSNTTIVVASDDNAFPGLMVLSASVAINHQKGSPLFIYFIDCGLSHENKKMLSDSLFAINPMARCEFRKPDARKLTGLRVETAGLFTYARLVSAELFS